MSQNEAHIAIMQQAADKAGRALVRDFGEVENLQVLKKGPGDFVSKADQKAEKIIVEHLLRMRPDHAILGEESGASGQSDAQYRFVIDPLDGTSNFLHALPHFAISIALEERGEVIAALVHDPIKQETFTAFRGGGAFLNARRIRISARRHLSQAMIGCGLPILDWEGRKTFDEEYRQIADNVAGLRRWGAAALDLAYIAAGRLDGFWEYGLKYWDLAAGTLLVQEAGGIVSMLEGVPFNEKGTIVAGNPNVQNKMQRVLMKARQAR